MLTRIEHTVALRHTSRYLYSTFLNYYMILNNRFIYWTCKEWKSIASFSQLTDCAPIPFNYDASNITWHTVLDLDVDKSKHTSTSILFHDHLKITHLTWQFALDCSHNIVTPSQHLHSVYWPMKIDIYSAFLSENFIEVYQMNVKPQNIYDGIL